METYRQQLTAYWQQRSRREQQLLLAMGVVLAVAVLLLGVWEPAAKAAERNRASAARLQAELNYVQSLAAEADRLKRQPAQTALPAKELIPLLQQVAQSQGLGGGVQFSADGEMGVNMEGVVGFDAWARLAGVLAAQHQVRVQSLRLEAQPTPGQAHIKALLVHAGAAA